MSLTRKLALLSLISLVGCSTTTSNTGETIRYALFGADDITVTKAHVSELPYASAYLKIGDNPRVFVVLAYVNGEDFSWLTADNVMIITRHGRIIKTVGLENDLVSLINESTDPLAAKPTTKAEWQAIAEWQQRYVSGYQMKGRIIQHEKETLDLVANQILVNRFEEKITLMPSSTCWTNTFWRDSSTGQVVKTQQQLGPNMPVIELTILKPFSS
ncbi:MAG: YjbF family lipoprotein [Plesiomonas sp.]|uniref:YjbF family lipoprotein n=1 Tax=Plesiomonas sp. TaxID=2486279 RepID=UPI003F320ECD